jgi:hypothetical protein
VEPHQALSFCKLKASCLNSRCAGHAAVGATWQEAFACVQCCGVVCSGLVFLALPLPAMLAVAATAVAFAEERHMAMCIGIKVDTKVRATSFLPSESQCYFNELGVLYR